MKKLWLMALALLVALTLTACGSSRESSGIVDDDNEEGGNPQVLSYVGTQTCLTCHADKETFLETGHNFKLNKVVDGQMPEYPFSTIEGVLEQFEGVESTYGTPTSYADISYVIGGYKGWVNFMDLDGYILTGTKVSASIGPDGTYGFIAGYRPGAGPEAEPFWCGTCHTTGWKAYTSREGDDRNLNRQDDLPGMGGTFNQAGIQCESCHGAGGEHAAAPSKANITRLAEGRLRGDLEAEDMGFGLAQACEECHTSAGERLYSHDFYTDHTEEFGGDILAGAVVASKRAYRGGRQAADTLLGFDVDAGVAMGKKRNFYCSTCHDPHKSEHWQDQPDHEGAMVANCTDCHTSQEFGGSAIAQSAHKFTANCVDCHMPGGSHFFKIDISEPSNNDDYHLSEYGDGAYSKPWLTSKESCGGCHADDYDARAAAIGAIHQ